MWHARQCLLIGLARGGMENPPTLQRCATLLQSCLRERHVLIRELAAQTLRTLVESSAIAADEAGELDAVNRSCLPETTCTGWLPASENETHRVPESRSVTTTSTTSALTFARTGLARSDVCSVWRRMPSSDAHGTPYDSAWAGKGVGGTKTPDTCGTSSKTARPSILMDRCRGQTICLRTTGITP